MVAGGRSVPVGAWLVALALFAALAVFGSRYGYHRDELHFIEAGWHPAWGVPPQNSDFDCELGFLRVRLLGGTR